MCSMKRSHIYTLFLRMMLVYKKRQHNTTKTKPSPTRKCNKHENAVKRINEDTKDIKFCTKLHMTLRSTFSLSDGF